MSTEKQKRGRKSKKEEENIIFHVEPEVVTDVMTQPLENILFEKSETDVNIEPDVDIDVEIPKKRGRKPKGGKIVQQVVVVGDHKVSKPNVILHLRCSLKDIHCSTATQSNIQSFNFETNKSDLSYEIISNDENIFTNNNPLLKNPLFTGPEGNPRKPPHSGFGPTFSKGWVEENGGPSPEGSSRGRGLCPSVEQNFCSIFSKETSCDEEQEDYHKKDNELKDVWKKLKALEHNLHVNNISDKKSACFWCTCEFDNPPIYIPKSYMKETYNVYGCFCSPECAVAHLMEENIDSSAKFERYHMVNHIYTKVYNYTKNIKPAPNPYYLLDKFYGNLSIQEYRLLLRNERLFLIVDKPLTRILPELHEDNDDFIINNKIIPSNTYQIKKKVQRKQQSKNTILNEKFGF